MVIKVGRLFVRVKARHVRVEPAVRRLWWEMRERERGKGEPKKRTAADNTEVKV
jgi:hypothetical protein